MSRALMTIASRRKKKLVPTALGSLTWAEAVAREYFTGHKRQSWRLCFSNRVIIYGSCHRYQNWVQSYCRSRKDRTRSILYEDKLDVVSLSLSSSAVLQEGSIKPQEAAHM